jgi:YVTN family beta-propeller protein
MSKKIIEPVVLIAGFLTVFGFQFSVFGTNRDRPSLSENRIPKSENRGLRQPMALVVADEGRRLFVANRCAGTVSVIDVERGRVLGETTVGRRLSDLVDGGFGRLLALDEAAGELIVLKRDKDSLAASARLHVGDVPVSICRLAPSRAAVACLWPRQLVLVGLAASEKPHVGKTISLPFAPRCQLALKGGAKIVVADAFGGKLAVVDVERCVVESVRTIPVHNIRGLALSAGGKELLLTQQLLAEETPTRSDDIRWGNVITNGVRSLSVDDLLQPNADLLSHSRLHPVGRFGRGAADPAGLAVIGDKIVTALAGTGEVAFGPELHGDWPRLPVGRRPTAVAHDGNRLFVADTFGDTITVIDSDTIKKTADISLGPTPELTPAQRGELLFFDARLSVEGWMSCHSCHSDGHTNGLRSDTLGDGSYGAPKRVPTLLGVSDTAPWAWNGSMAHLEEQVLKSIRTTMRGPRPTEQQVADLTAYLRTLLPPPHGGSSGESVRRGEIVFQARGCVRCHTPPTYTTSRTYEVDLEDAMGKKTFNPPSLRGVSHGVAFFHDGRAATLDEVLTRYRHQVPGDTAKQEIEDLLAFLRSL